MDRPDRILFSEVKKGLHMAIVTASENRAEARDIYLPAHERGMGHRSYLSPDKKSLLIPATLDDGSTAPPCRPGRRAPDRTRNCADSSCFS
jgi:eukaryotic-like serine/threonine-protein kinase